jgi:hypothetical protein
VSVSVSVSNRFPVSGFRCRLRDRLQDRLQDRGVGVHVQGSVGNGMMVAATTRSGSNGMAKKQHTYARAKRKRNAKRALDTRAREQEAAATKAAPEAKAAASAAKRARAAKKKAAE